MTEAKLPALPEPPDGPFMDGRTLDRLNQWALAYGAQAAREQRERDAAPLPEETLRGLFDAMAADPCTVAFSSFAWFAAGAMMLEKAIRSQPDPVAMTPLSAAPAQADR